MGWRSRGYGDWPAYVPVSQRMGQARKKAEQLARKGATLEPVSIEGRTIARTFWGKAWCDHLHAFSDFSNRMPRGRSYLANGLVIDLRITAGRVEALVSGTSLYTIKIQIAKLAAGRWAALRKACAGRIDTLVELLQGRLADDVMRQVCDRA